MPRSKFTQDERLFRSLRVGIHAARPVTGQGSQPTDDIRPLRRTVAALADIVTQVEEQQVVRVNHELPVALTHRLLRTGTAVANVSRLRAAKLKRTRTAQR